MANEWLKYANQGATRSQPLSPELVAMLEKVLPSMGLSMEVFSGGQPSSGPNRVGSHRHDYGNAADVFFSKGDRRLDWANPEDLPVFVDLVRQARAAGVTGIGAGEGYMRPGSMHIGLGSPSVWGAGGQGENAPDWLKEAYYQGALKSQPNQYAMKQPEAQNPLGLPPPDPLGAFGDYATQMASANAPAGPVEAAGGGAGSEAVQTPAAASPLIAEDEKAPKSLLGKLGKGVTAGAKAYASAKPFSYDVPTTPGPARVDVGAAPIIDPQQAEMKRQQLAQIMARLNSGSLI